MGQAPARLGDLGPVPLTRSAIAVLRKIGGATTFGSAPVGMWSTNWSSSGLSKAPEKGLRLLDGRDRHQARGSVLGIVETAEWMSAWAAMNA
jgi:hypothetical protein